MLCSMNTQFSYLAGYFDGDGHFSIRKRFNKKGFVYSAGGMSVGSVYTCALDMFQTHAGGWIRSRIPKNKNWKKQFEWCVEGKKALELSKKIYPFLVEKTDECKVFIRFLSKCIGKESQVYIEEIKKIRDGRTNFCKQYINELKKRFAKVEPTQEDFSYFAGYIDAECSLGVSKSMSKNKPNFSYKIRFICGTTDSAVIEWIFNRFGGHIHYSSKTQPNWKDKIFISISCKKLYEILPNIIPFLRLKKEVCEKIMEFQKTNLANGGDRTSEYFKKRYSEVVRVREDLIKSIHLLNLKGSYGV